MPKLRADALTDLTIRGLKSRSGQTYEIFDTKVPGFAIRVFPSGIKSFVLFVRQHGKQRRLTIGRYPALALAEARKRAQTSLHRIAHGEDPQPEKTVQRDGFAFNDTVRTFLDTHCARFNRPNTARETARVLNAQFTMRWGNRDIREIRRADIVAALDTIVANGSPSAANHALAAIRKLFNWYVERGLLEQSPCAAIKKPVPHCSRDRVLADLELAAIWEAAGAMSYPYGTIVQLLILTAQRRGEVTGMRWSEIDFDKRTWSIPAARTKSNRQQVLPLVPAAIDILSTLPKLDEERVFPAQGNSETAFSGFSKAKRRLDQVSETSDWTVHDLRRTAATGMAQLGVAPHIVERILNHTSGSLGGVAGVYNRFGYLPEMRTALATWAAHVANLVGARLKQNEIA